MTIITGFVALTVRQSVTTAYLAGPLDQVNAWSRSGAPRCKSWAGRSRDFGMVLVGIKLGAKSVASNGAGTGHREAVGRSSAC